MIVIFIWNGGKNLTLASAAWLLVLLEKGSMNFFKNGDLKEKSTAVYV